MISRIVHFSIQNKFIVALFVMALIAAGIYSMRSIPIDAVPDITNNQVQIVTSSTSLAAQEVEQFISFPVEMAMANIPNVLEIRSISRFGLSVVTVVFKDFVPILEARQFVQEQINVARENIPQELGTPTMMPITTGLGEIYQYTLQVDSAYREFYDPMKLRTIQDWIVKRQLAGIPGIIEVSSFGGYLKQYEVSLFPGKLKDLNLTITDVFKALETNNQNSGGSYIEKGPNAYYIRTEGIVKNIEDIENIVVSQTGKTPILIKDLAEVKMGFPPRFGAMTKDGKGETVGGIALMLKGANSSDAIKNVQNRIAEVQKTLPEGVKIEPYLDRSDLVGKTIGTVTRNLVEGGLIVIFVLILLLGNFRAGLIVASVIPLSLFFAFIMMNIFGVSANLMSLGAIDFGIVIDGAVVIVEAILHTVHGKYSGKKMTQKEMDELISVNSARLINSSAFGVLIILVVFIPIMTLVGVEGKMFRPMAQTVSFAVLGALILSFTYVPMISALFLNKNIVEKRTLADKIMDALKRRYKPTLEIALNIPKVVIASAIALLISAALAFNFMGQEFIPTLEEGDLAMQMAIKPGSSLSESINATTKAEKILMENFPEVIHVVSKIGTAEVPTDPMAVEDADIMIVLKEKGEWTSAKTREELIEKMKEKLDAVKGASFDFTQPIQLRFNELMTGAKSDVAVKIFGEDMTELAAKAEKAAKIIEKIPGAGDVKVEQTDGLPQILIHFDRAKIATYGLNINDVNQIVRAAFAGESAGIVYEGEKRFDLVVRLNKASREHMELARLYINTPNGQMIPLNELATVEYSNGPMQISREQAQRRIVIGINIRNRDIASFIEEVETKLDAGLNLKPGYTIKYGGQFENLQAATKRLKIAVPIALALIFILLYMAFNSFKYTAIIFMTVPLAAIGGVATLLIRGMPFSISAGVGFIALFGVAVLNGIVLISYFNRLKDEGQFDSLRDLVIEGGLTRLRPVVLTAAVASLGFLPMAISTSAGAEVQKPLATVVIGGLITSTFLTLVVLPVIYFIFEKKSFRLNKQISAVIVLFGLFLWPNVSGAQKLSLNQAIDSAYKYNASLNISNFETELEKINRKTGFLPQKTGLALQYGQINSQVNDFSLEISQSLGNPLALVSAQKLSKSKLEALNANHALIKKEVKWQLQMIWAETSYIKSRVKNIEQQMKLLDNLSQKAQKQYNSGDISLQEYKLLEIPKNRLMLDYKNLLALLNSKIAELKLLIGKDIQEFDFEPDMENLTNDSLSAGLHQDFNLYYQKNKEIALRQTTLAKSNLFPELSVGYFQQSIDNQNGFKGVMADLQIPLTSLLGRKEIRQAAVQLKINIQKLDLQASTWDLNYSIIQNQYNELMQLYNAEGKEWQKQADELIALVNTEIENGNQNYYYFVQIYAQALAQKDNFDDLIKQIFQAKATYQYYAF